MAYFVIIRGPSGIGKSTISKELSKILGAYYIPIDDFLEKEGLDNINEKEGCIPVKNFTELNKNILPKIKSELEKDKIVIIDGNFYHKEQIENIINNLSYLNYVFSLKAPLKVCIERDNKRQNSYGKKATTEVYRLVSKLNHGTLIDTNNKSINQVIEEVRSYLPSNILKLNNLTSFTLNPKPPYNFDANMHKPSHFPSSDNIWEKGFYWIGMIWKRETLGLKIENLGSINKPKIKFNVYSDKKLSKEFVDSLIFELRWRFNLDTDISEFCSRFKSDKTLGRIIEKWEGMKPIAANSLYETLIIYITLQNASVRRSVQMLESLFNQFGRKILFDNRTISTFWEPEKILKSSEEELRKLKVGYRAKTFMILSKQFANKEINELKLRKLNKEEIKEQMLKLYGIGPASLQYILFEDFYILDDLVTIPPWETKIMSRLLFNKESVPSKDIMNFLSKFKGYEKLAFHYIWEDVFWKKKHEHIAWLEKEIRL